jgi:hypothetical protein
MRWHRCRPTGHSSHQGADVEPDATSQLCHNGIHRILNTMAGEDPEYQRFLRDRGCVMYGHGDCLGAVHVHHAPGGKGIGQRNHDDSGKPLCAKHHTERHSLSGPFKGWGKQRIRDTAGYFRRLYLGLAESDPLDF